MKENNHSKFRRTSRWKEFREVIVRERNSRCELCGIRKKGLQLHHLNPNSYEDLDPVKFVLICSSCHELVERFARRLHGKKSGEIANKEKWLDLLGPFLPTKEEKTE